MAFYDFPTMHWQSIRTSNPIESTFGTASNQAIEGLPLTGWHVAHDVTAVPLTFISAPVD